MLVKVHGVLVLEVEHQSWAQNMYRMGQTIKMQGGRKEIRITRGEINKVGSRRAKNMPTKNKSGTVPRKEDERRSKGKAGNKSDGERERNRMREGGRVKQVVKGRH
jgi:hypothetical protein